MMSWITFGFSILAGGALGWIYVGGLWHTVTHVHDARRPALYLFVSFVVRALVVVAGFAVLMQSLGTPLIVAGGSLLGFMVVRLVLVRTWGRLSVSTSRSSP